MAPLSLVVACAPFRRPSISGKCAMASCMRRLASFVKRAMQTSVGPTGGLSFGHWAPMDFHMAGPGLYLEMAAEGKTQVLIAGLVKARQPAEPGILSIGPDNPSCIGVA